MDTAEIREYAGLMRELGLTALEISGDGHSLRLERGAGTAAAAAPDSRAGESAAVRSPMVGVFYAAPAENAAPFAAVGDMVEKGQTLCLIEAMKLMNEIKAEFSGVVTEVCAANGQTVDYGAELFRIRRS